MKENYFTVCVWMAVTFGLYLLLSQGCTSEPNHTEVELTNTIRIINNQYGPNLHVVEYEGKTYLVSQQGGIIEHKKAE